MLYGCMGVLNRLTRELLKEWVDESRGGRDEFDAFLDDVAEGGLSEACSSRGFTMQAVLGWIGDVNFPDRAVRYSVAKRIKSEILVHRALETAAGADDPKLEIDTSFRVAKAWDAGQYGDRGEKGGGGGITVVIDKSCGGAVRIGLQDGDGNVAAVEVGGGVSRETLVNSTEPRFSGAEEDLET